MNTNENNNLIPKDSDFLLYTTPDGEIRVDVFFHDETVWLTQKKMAELFGVDVRTVNEHIKNIYESGELRASATIRKFRIVQKEGKRDVNRGIDFYNLDTIISVGYRVNSEKATKFRIWATKMLLTTWKNAPKGKILKPDVSIAKNYLQEKEISELNRIVSMYLDYAENQAKKQRTMTMNDWVEKLDAFLKFNENVKFINNMLRLHKQDGEIRIPQERPALQRQIDAVERNLERK